MGTMPTPPPLCFVCLVPIAESRRFARGAGPEYRKAKRPLTAFGLCERHTPAHGQVYFLASRVRDDAYTCVSVTDAKHRLSVTWPRSGAYRPTVTARDFRRAFLRDACSCICGSRATQLGHLAPRYWSCLNRLPPDAADFPDNFTPMCADCNQRWMKRFPLQDDVDEYWSARSDAYSGFSALLMRALASARDRGVHLYAPPDVRVRELPGQPVLALPTDRGSFFFDIIGYADRSWRRRLDRHRSLGIRGPTFSGSLRGYVTPYLRVADSAPR
jgi:hypothetical protein